MNFSWDISVVVEEPAANNSDGDVDSLPVLTQQLKLVPSEYQNEDVKVS